MIDARQTIHFTVTWLQPNARCIMRMPSWLLTLHSASTAAISDKRKMRRWNRTLDGKSFHLARWLSRNKARIGTLRWARWEHFAFQWGVLFRSSVARGNRFSVFHPTGSHWQSEFRAETMVKAHLGVPEAWKSSFQRGLRFRRLPSIHRKRGRVLANCF